MKVIADIPAELGRALDELAAMRALLSSHLRSHSSLSPGEMHGLIHSTNDTAASLERILATGAPTKGSSLRSK
jgi:hypothetical protein